jgi:hypothetical protein
MVWLLIGYMYLFIHRPFEIWEPLGTMRLELLYALFTGGMWLLSGSKRWLPNPLHRAFFALTFAVVVCWAASPWAAQGFDTVDKFLKQMVIYVIMVTVIRDEEDLNRVGRAYLVIMTIYMLHSLLEFTHGRFHYRMEVRRLIGVDATASDPNAFAATLVYSIALTPALWLTSRSWLWRGFVLFYGLLTAGCVALTGSRSGFACLGLWVCLTILRSRWRYAFGALAVASAPIVWAALPKDLQARFETIINPDAGPRSAQVSAHGRFQGLQKGMELFSESPLTGCGPGAWTKATHSKLQSHNLYGQVMGELGLLGVLPFLAIVLFFWLNVRAIKKAYRAHPEWGHDNLYQYAQCLGTALLLLLIYGNVAHNLFRYHWLWYGAFLIVVRHRVRQRLQESADVAPAADEIEGGEADEADPDWDDPPPARELAGLAPGGSHG